jgi:hypothetical protein
MPRYEIDRFSCADGSWGWPDGFSGPEGLNWDEMVIRTLVGKGYPRDEAELIITRDNFHFSFTAKPEEDPFGLSDNKITWGTVVIEFPEAD